MGTRTVLANTAFNLAGLAISSLLALLLTPFLLVQLGEALFGLWALGNVLITAAPLAALGLGRALARNVAQALAVDHPQSIRGDFSGSWWAVLVSSGLLVLLGWPLAEGLAGFLGAPPALVPLAARIIRLLLLALPPVALSQLLAAAIEGGQRMAYSSGALTLGRTLFAGGAVLAVLGGRGPAGVAAAYSLSAWVQLVLLALAVRRVLPQAQPLRRLPAAAVLRRDLRFGGLVFAGQGVGLAFTAANKIILARAVSLESVAYFEFAAVSAMQLFNIANAASAAFYPALAAAQAGGGRQAVRRLYLGGLRLLGHTLLPLAALIVALAGPFVAAWYGQSQLQASGGLQVLAAAWALAGLATLAAAGFQALGSPGTALVFALYNLLANLILALALAPRWGYWGVIAANAFAVGSSALLTLAGFAFRSRASVQQVLAALSPPSLLWLALLAAGLGLLAGQIHSPALWLLAVLAAGYAALYVAGLWGLRLLRPAEIALLRRWLGRRARIVQPGP